MVTNQIQPQFYLYASILNDSKLQSEPVKLVHDTHDNGQPTLTVLRERAVGHLNGVLVVGEMFRIRLI